MFLPSGASPIRWLPRGGFGPARRRVTMRHETSANSFVHRRRRQSPYAGLRSLFLFKYSGGGQDALYRYAIYGWIFRTAAAATTGIAGVTARLPPRPAASRLQINDGRLECPHVNG